MPLEPLSISPTRSRFEPFEVRLPAFAGPLALLLHLIESRQLDVLSVPLAEVADAYVAHLATTTVDMGALSEFVSIAAQLILLKSRRLLPGDPASFAVEQPEEADEEELRQRLIEYRAVRDAAAALGDLDLVAPLVRREPRVDDLPEAPLPPLPAGLLATAMAALLVIPEPEEPAPQLMAREITIGMQITALRAALAGSGRIILQQLLATCRSRTEATVTILATLELVRRRQIRVQQDELFGPILVETAP
jgi:segregation and condensation protein A